MVFKAHISAQLTREQIARIDAVVAAGAAPSRHAWVRAALLGALDAFEQHGPVEHSPVASPKEPIAS